MTNSLDKRNEIITDLLIDAWDLGRLLAEYENHYQRGVEAGKTLSAIDPEQLKAEYQRGRDDYKREILARLDEQPIGSVADVVAPKAPIAKSIEEAKPVPSVAVRRNQPIDNSRPEGIPANLYMATKAIAELGGQAEADDILAYVRKTWWPNIPTYWKTQLIKMVNHKHLARAGVFFVMPGRKDPLAHVEKEPAAHGVDLAVAERIAAIESKPAHKPPPRQLSSGVIKFEHKGRTAILSTTREYTFAGKLRAAMGNGHVAEAFLADKVMGANTENNRMIVKDICLGMNPALADVGLKIEHYPGFGLLMKDVVA